MQVAREQDRIRLKLNPLEARIFEQVLRLIIKHYRLGPAELDPKGAAAWYSKQGCKTAGMTPEETNDWIETLHELRSGRLGRLEEWVTILAARKAPVIDLEFTFAEASNLLTVLNDHRLFVAARHDIGQHEMDLHPVRALKQLTVAQQNAVCEIHFLAIVMEELLRFVAPEASGWME